MCYVKTNNKKYSVMLFVITNFGAHIYLFIKVVAKLKVYEIIGIYSLNFNNNLVLKKGVSRIRSNRH